MMNILTVVGLFGVIGTAGALECDTVTFAQACLQMVLFGGMTLACFTKSDFIA